MSSVWFGELFVSSDIMDLFSRSLLNRFLRDSGHMELGNTEYRWLWSLRPSFSSVSFPLRVVIISHGPFFTVKS